MKKIAFYFAFCFLIRIFAPDRLYVTPFKFGRDEKALEIARRMKAKGYTIADITEMTGLTDKEISAL